MEHDIAVHLGISGPRRLVRVARFPRLDKLAIDCVRATDQTRRKQLAEEIQKVALEEVRSCRGANGSRRRPSAGRSRAF